MNLIYITNQDFEKKHNIGVIKKCVSQNKVFRNEMDSCLGYARGKNYYIENDGKEELICKHNNLYSSKLFRFEKFDKYIIDNKIEYVYIRYSFSDPSFIYFLKKIRPYVRKIFIEIPTYPYDNEAKNNLRNSIYLNIFDKRFRGYLKKYVDKIVTFSNDDEIFGIQTIKITNGIDVENIKLREKKEYADKKEINIIGVALISFWHGYDRVISGLNEYYQKNGDQSDYIIKFHIVGDGPELQNLKNIVNKYNLSKYIFFYGIKNEKELDDIFDKCDIAIGSLGIHRIKGIERISPLKSREYMARGIPFIYSYKDLESINNEDFTFRFLENDEAIDINQLIYFYKKISDIKDINIKMRKYAEQYFSWNVQMKIIIDSLKK